MPPAYNPAKNIPPLSTAEVQDLNVQIRTYRQDYLRYWMKGTAASSAAAASSSSTTTTTTTIGRPAVDALIMPIAPYAAARIGGIRWSGYPTPVVLNDHSAAVLPVLRTDKNVDVKGPAPPQASEGRYAKVNKAVYDDCKCCLPVFFCSRGRRRVSRKREKKKKKKKKKEKNQRQTNRLTECVSVE